MSRDTYNGGKSGSGTYQAIINQVPPHDVYIAGFAGHDGVFRKMAPAHTSLLVDIDKKVVDWWWKYFESLAPYGTDVIHKSFFDFVTPEMLRDCYAGKKIFLYLDSPYLMETRKNQQQLYTHEMGTAFEHTLLLARALELAELPGVYIAISCYDNSLYRDMLPGWRKISYTTRTHKGIVITETLYMNYPEPEQLHDYTYYGKNHRHRELIKSMKNNMVAKLAAMPPQQRNLILKLVNETDWKDITTEKTTARTTTEKNTSAANH